LGVQYIQGLLLKELLRTLLSLKVFYMSETHNTPTHTDNGRGHELADANVGALAKFGIGLGIISAVVLALMVWFQNYLDVGQKKSAAPPSPLAGERQLPPGPHLQVVPEKDLAQVRAVEDSLLSSYGWIVRDAGVVRIPIDRAIELVVKRGLPYRAGSEEREAKSEARVANSEWREAKIEERIAKAGNGDVQP
jgi:hypothetical protein